MNPFFARTLSRAVTTTVFALALGGCGSSSDPAPPPSPPPACNAVASATLDVTYKSVGVPAQDALLTLDVYAPPAATTCSRLPVVVWVHGGGWHTGDKGNQMVNKVPLFTGQGYLLVSINYRLSPTPVANPDPGRLLHPVHTQDVASAVAWLRSNIARWGGDGQKIALLGHSAGAHLAALVGTDGAFLAAHGLPLNALRCVGAYDSEGLDIPTAMLTAGPTQSGLFINAFGTDAALWTQASPITHVSAGKGIAPIQLACRGAADRVAICTSMRDKLLAAGVTATVIDASSMTHEEVNERIGAPGDTVMTPPVMSFLSSTCFR